MTPRKLAFGWRIHFIVRRAKKLSKKAQYEPKKFDLQYRNDFLIRKIKTLLKLFRVKLVVKGYENLGSGPALLVANHQDNVDSVLLLYALKKQTEDREEVNKIATFLAKHTLLYDRHSRHILTSIDTFFLNRNDPKASLETYQNFGKFVKANKTFGIIFAEGTRNQVGDVGPFKPGAFKVAKKELLPIIPVTINNSVQGYNLNRKTWLEVEIIFHKKIPALSLTTQTTIAIAERVHQIVKSRFKPPQLPFIASPAEAGDIETSKAAIKWHKQEAKREHRAVKKAQKERRQEQRLLEAQHRDDQKYEKYQAKLKHKHTQTDSEGEAQNTDETN